ncbi:MAG: gluconate 2-dehydrogenase subunit 3 family protein [Verrucomicrobia bacterium]|nr:gluconate 2-dehydrogenase subunit 3 family protein [Verrucomicrobiota bacterium]
MRSVDSDFLSLTSLEARTLEAVFERMFPADENGAGAVQIGAARYVDRALAGAYADRIIDYQNGLAALSTESRHRFGKVFPEIAEEQQCEIIRDLEKKCLLEFDGNRFFELLRSHLQEGLFADPEYGGNRDKLGWKFLRHPGVWLENSAEENLTDKEVDKGGKIQSLGDLGSNWKIRQEPVNGYDPLRGSLPPSTEVDVILVGVGSIGAIVAPIFAKAGLRVIGLEPGPYRRNGDYLPDELGAAYYCRANMGPKFASEIPRWRRAENEPTQEATFSLGRMMNSVGGSMIHYGAWMRRFHSHHFRMESYISDRWGTNVLPERCRVADWPVSYEQLEPYYTLLEEQIGIAGDDTNPFVQRSRPLPMPATRPFRLGECFREATTALGLHPHPVAVGMNTRPYRGRPASTYTAWSNGFGSYTGDKWDPSLTCVPEALRTGNFDLRTQCRVIRILSDSEGHVDGIE